MINSPFSTIFSIKICTLFWFIENTFFSQKFSKQTTLEKYIIKCITRQYWPDSDLLCKDVNHNEVVTILQICEIIFVLTHVVRYISRTFQWRKTLIARQNNINMYTYVWTTVRIRFILSNNPRFRPILSGESEHQSMTKSNKTF